MNGASQTAGKATKKPSYMVKGQNAEDLRRENSVTLEWKGGAVLWAERDRTRTTVILPRT